MPGPLVQSTLITSRGLPSPVQDGQSPPGAPRGGRYQEQMVYNPFPLANVMADEGTLVVASMSPGQTALQLGLSAAWSATAAAFVLVNSDTPGNPLAKRIFPRKLNLVVSGAPTSATNWQYATFIDNVNRAPTILTGGGNTALTAATATAFQPNANNTNMSNNAPVMGRAYFPISTAAGAPPTIPAAGPAVRQLRGNGILRGQIPVVGDNYTIAFGLLDEPAGQQLTAAPAGYSRIVEPHEPLALDPGQSLVIYMWGLSNASAGIIFSDASMSWAER